MEKTFMRNRLSSLAVAALVAASMASFANPSSAMPVADGTTLKNSTASHIENVRWRGRGWGIGAGLLGGAIIGGAIANSYYGGPYGPYYGGPGPYYAPAYGPGYYAPPPGDAIAYCMNTYRSYDPRSGTYLGYDGYRHACP